MFSQNPTKWKVVFEYGMTEMPTEDPIVTQSRYPTKRELLNTIYPQIEMDYNEYVMDHLPNYTSISLTVSSEYIGTSGYSDSVIRLTYLGEV